VTVLSSQPRKLSLTGGGFHEIEIIGGIEPFFGVGVPLWKRSMDIVGASVLLVLLLPVFIGVATLIKLVSRGPVIYRQDRLGVGGRKFSFLKFRTMQVADSDACHQQYLQRLIACGDTCPPPMKKLDHCNPNIIPLGRFLRSTCLDELPQLINVLRGDMSLVGPRPPIPYEAAAYMPWHSTRFNCLPGMTGLWQISGKNRLCFRDMIRLDIRYAREMSFWTDIEILFKTPFSIWREYSLAKDADRQDGKD
jgi:lipopolysaccharide/colanic/teichoic acid biosynthesis glycosyltransferase